MEIFGIVQQNLLHLHCSASLDKDCRRALSWVVSSGICRLPCGGSHNCWACRALPGKPGAPPQSGGSIRGGRRLRSPGSLIRLAQGC